MAVIVRPIVPSKHSPYSGLRTPSRLIFEVQNGISLWGYFGRPKGAVARERGNRVIVGTEPILHGGLVYDYDWTKLRVIMQDKPEVIESAKKVWHSTTSNALVI